MFVLFIFLKSFLQLSLPYLFPFYFFVLLLHEIYTFDSKRFERHCFEKGQSLSLSLQSFPSCVFDIRVRRGERGGLCAAGCGAKSPRNFLNVLAKCSNPQYMYRHRGWRYGGANVCVWIDIFILRTLLCHMATSVTVRGSRLCEQRQK